ncbi:hypothetical protein [Selenomonas ruminantium]|uniref:hypothetical protein n=1 Tax=Selenomonas ruminantium TaxID=971 RepID=UPI0026F00102|nr:hypothetical protein [Selenomonas ruminantium]
MRRPEHPQGLETDDWNAAGMEPHSPTAARQESRKVSAAKWAGFLPTRAAGHKPNTHERRAGLPNPSGHIEAMRAEGMAA